MGFISADWAYVHQRLVTSQTLMSVEIHKWLEAGSSGIYFHFIPSLHSFFLVLCHTSAFFNLHWIPPPCISVHRAPFWILKHCTQAAPDHKQLMNPCDRQRRPRRVSPRIPGSSGSRCLLWGNCACSVLMTVTSGQTWGCFGHLFPNPPPHGHGQPLLCCCVVCRVHFFNVGCLPILLHFKPATRLESFLSSHCLCSVCFTLHFSPALFFLLRWSVVASVSVKEDSPKITSS